MLLRRTGGSLTFFLRTWKNEAVLECELTFYPETFCLDLKPLSSPLKYFGDSHRSHGELGCLMLLSGCVQLGVARQLPDGPGKLLITP